MIKTLTKHDGGLALVLDPSILERLDIDEETRLNVTVNGQQLIVARDDPARRAQLDQAFDETVREYDNMLKRLAQ